MIPIKHDTTTYSRTFLQQFSSTTPFQFYAESWENVDKENSTQIYRFNVTIFEFSVTSFNHNTCTVAFGFPTDLRINEPNYFSDAILPKLIIHFFNFFSSAAYKCCSLCKNCFLMVYSNNIIPYLFEDKFLKELEIHHTLLHPRALIEYEGALQTTIPIAELDSNPSFSPSQENEQPPPPPPSTCKHVKRIQLDNFERPMSKIHFSFFS